MWKAKSAKQRKRRIRTTISTQNVNKYASKNNKKSERRNKTTATTTQKCTCSIFINSIYINIYRRIVYIEISSYECGSRSVCVLIIHFSFSHRCWRSCVCCSSDMLDDVNSIVEKKIVCICHCLLSFALFSHWNCVLDCLSARFFCFCFYFVPFPWN